MSVKSFVVLTLISNATNQNIQNTKIPILKRRQELEFFPFFFIKAQWNDICENFPKLHRPLNVSVKPGQMAFAFLFQHIFSNLFRIKRSLFLHPSQKEKKKFKRQFLKQVICMHYIFFVISFQLKLWTFELYYSRS